MSACHIFAEQGVHISRRIFVINLTSETGHHYTHPRDTLTNNSWCLEQGKSTLESPVVLRALKHAFCGVFVITFLMATASGVFANRADENAFTTTQGNHLVKWDTPWELADGAGRQAVSGEEAIVLENPAGATLVVAVLNADSDLVAEQADVTSAQEAESDTFSIVDSGSYGNVIYSLTSFSASGKAFGAFSLFIDGGLGSEDVGYVLVSPAQSFSKSMSGVQNSITVDSEPVFAGIDPEGLKAQLGMVGESATNAGTSPEPTESPDTNRVSSGEQWVDPTFGYAVSWDSNWTETSPAGSASFAIANGSSAIAGFVAVPGTGSPAVLLFEDFQQVFLEGLPAGARVLASMVGGDEIILAAETQDGLFVQNIFFIDNDQTIVIATIFVQGSNPGSTISEFRNSVTIAGRQPLTYWEEIYP
jgi:hypothetical protein